MRQGMIRWRVQAALTGVVVAGGALIATSLSQETSGTGFDPGRYAEVMAAYRQSALFSVEELVAEYEFDQLMYLPIIPPGPPDPLHVGRNRSMMIHPKSFPDWFINGLVPVTRSIEGRSYVAYPVWIQEDAKTRDRVVYAADDAVIGRMAPPEDYDPFWLLNDGLGGLLSAQDSAYAEWMKAVFDPARIIGHFDLVTEEAVMVIAAAAATPTGPGSGMAMMMSGEDASNLCFIACEPYDTNGAVEVTLAWPEDFTNNVSIITCTNLPATNWSLLMTTNLPTSTNTLTFVDTNSCSSSQQFYHAYNADVNASTDPDGDGVTTGEERFLLETDPEDEHDPANIKGTLGYDTYSGGQTGPIYVVAVTTSNSWSTNVCDTLSATGAYHIVKVPTNDYWVKAWRDSDVNGSVGTYEATGMYDTVSMSVTGQHTNVNVTLADPDMDSDGMGDWWEGLHFGSLDRTAGSDYDEDKLSNLNEYIAGTDPTAGFEDADSDGMSDDWEDAYGLDANDPSDADDDPDFDGFTNLEEYKNNGGDFGTDPNDPLSHPTGAIYVSVTNGNDTTGDGSYTNAYKTIKKGITEASNGDRVAVMPGTYTGGNTNRNLTFQGKSISLLGLEGAASTIVDCEGESGAYQISSSVTNCTVRGLTFLNGLAAGGGALDCSASNALIEACVFSDNTASSSGGAIDAEPGRITIRDCTFSGNAAPWGGAVYLGPESAVATSVVERCVFSENTAASGGGGIYASAASSAIAIRNCVMSGNAASGGGGIRCGSVASGLVIENCTIVDNEATYEYYPNGGGIRCGQSGLVVRNCVVWDNEPDQVNMTGDSNAVYSCIEDWTGSGEGVITNDPDFADAEFRLEYSSPCWNAGTNYNWMTNSMDLFGNTRLFNGVVDMGAHELTLYFADADNENAATPYTTWATAAATLQDAVDAAQGAEAIVVATNGVYTNGTTVVGGGVPCRVAVTEPIRVVSVNGADQTHIVGAGPAGASAIRCAYVGSNACLIGFALTNGHTRTTGDSLDVDGGGAWCQPGGIIQDCAIIGNDAEYGGGVYGGTVISSLLASNSADRGGALYGCFAERSVITNNTASYGGGVHGGTNRSCLIVGNEAAAAGGGVFNGTVENATIVSNSASSGNGTYQGTVRNSIIYYNGATNWSGGSFSYSCTTPPASGTGNIEDAPSFVDASAGNFALVFDSYGVDAGTNWAWMIGTQDLLGNARIQHGIVDMGAHEYNYIDPFRPALGTNRLEISDDGYTHTGANHRHDEVGYNPVLGQEPTAVDIGFEINFFGSNHTNLYVNNNGNLTFASENSTYTPEFLDDDLAIIAPFWGDVDTRSIPDATNGPVAYGQGDVEGRDAYGVTWTNAGYFTMDGDGNDKLNEFQVVLVDRSDITNGAFDLEYNYRQIEWEAGNASGGTNGLGGDSARVGFGDEDGVGFELPGSGVPGSLISGGENDLVAGRLNSDVRGRYTFHFRDGWPFDVLYEATMSMNPGWSYSGDWAYGVPTGASGDPTSGYKDTGSVIGYNLSGAYSNDMGTVSTTVSDIDCSTATSNVFLSFRRWLTLATNDMAGIEISTNDTSWSSIWNSASNVWEDGAWKHSLIDISPVAAGHSNVSIRWVMGPTDEDTVAGGWNLDEVRVLHIW